MAEFAEFLIGTRTNDAILVARRVLALDSTQSLAWMYLADAYLASERPQEAAAAYERCRPERWARCTAGVANADLAAGRSEDARVLVEELGRRAGEEYVSPIVLAWAYAGIGQTEQALAWLDRAVDDRSGWMYGELDLDPRLEQLHGDPRYERIKQRIRTLRRAPGN